MLIAASIAKFHVKYTKKAIREADIKIPNTDTTKGVSKNSTRNHQIMLVTHEFSGATLSNKRRHTLFLHQIMLIISK